MSDFTQSATQTLLAKQAITHPANVVGSPVDCSTWLAIQIYAWLANIETTANATGVSIAIQVSPETSGNDWADAVRFTGSITAAVDDELTAVEPAAETVIAIASTTGYTVGQPVYVRDDDNVAQSEWHEVAIIVTNTSITLVDGLAYEKAIADTTYSQAQVFTAMILLDGIKRIRAIVEHQAATGSDIHVKVTAVASTDIE